MQSQSCSSAAGTWPALVAPRATDCSPVGPNCAKLTAAAAANNEQRRKLCENCGPIFISNSLAILVASPPACNWIHARSHFLSSTERESERALANLCAARKQLRRLPIARRKGKKVGPALALSSGPSGSCTIGHKSASLRPQALLPLLAGAARQAARLVRAPLTGGAGPLARRCDQFDSIQKRHANRRTRIALERKREEEREEAL